jgi:hypothetical protein
MVTTESQSRRVARKGIAAELTAPVSKIRVETADNWHPEWSAVLAAVQRSGQDDALMIDRDGWVSARQTILVAFNGRRVVAYLAFHVAPMHTPAGVVMVEHGRAVLEARLDAIWVAPDAADHGLDQVLTGMAESHALMLQCRTFRHEATGTC